MLIMVIFGSGWSISCPVSSAYQIKERMYGIYAARHIEYEWKMLFNSCLVVGSQVSLKIIFQIVKDITWKCSIRGITHSEWNICTNNIFILHTCAPAYRYLCSAQCVCIHLVFLFLSYFFFYTEHITSHTHTRLIIDPYSLWILILFGGWLPLRFPLFFKLRLFYSFRHRFSVCLSRFDSSPLAVEHHCHELKLCEWCWLHAK